jgi:hypothetical protein
MAYNKPTIAEGNGINPWWVLGNFEWTTAKDMTGGWARSTPFLHSTTPGCRCWMQIWYFFLLNLESLTDNVRSRFKTLSIHSSR